MPFKIVPAVKSGRIKVNDNLLLGPFNDSSYKQVKVRSIHLNYRDVKEVNPGSIICLSLKNISRREIKKGMIVITDDNQLKISVKKFIAQIHVLHSPTTIKEGYQPFIHIDHVRQSVKINQIKKIDNITENNDIIYLSDCDTILRTGDEAIVQLEFINKPEYIKPAMRIIFREGNVRAVGKVINIL